MSLNVNKLMEKVSPKLVEEMGKYVLEAFFEELLEINDSERGWKITDGKAFERISAKYILNLFDKEIDDARQISGPRDKGIDIFYVDELRKKIIIMQNKFSQNLNSVVKEEDLSHLSIVLDRLENNERGNTIFNMAKNVYESNIKDGYGVELYFINAGKFTDSQKEQIKEIKEKFEKTNEQKHKNLSVTFITHDIYSLLAYFGDIKTPKCELIISETEYFSSNIAQNNVKNLPRLVATVRAKELIKTYRTVENSVFSLNPRSDLKRKEISEGMKNTIEQDANMFWHYNNGVSAICSNFTRDKTKLTIYDLKIVNGHQTVSMLNRYRQYLQNTEILFRLSCVIEPDKRDNISHFTNTQNPITNSDLLTNTHFIRQLVHDFKNWDNFLFEHKRSLINAVTDKKKYKPYALYVINRDYVCQYRMAYGLAKPFQAWNSSPQNMIESDQDFNDIFNGAKPEDFILPHIFKYLIDKIKKDVDGKNIEYVKLLGAKLSHYYILAMIGDVINGIKCDKEKLTRNITNYIADKSNCSILMDLIKNEIVKDFLDNIKMLEIVKDTDFTDLTPSELKEKFKNFEEPNEEKLFVRIKLLRKQIIDKAGNDKFKDEIEKLFNHDNSKKSTIKG